MRGGARFSRHHGFRVGLIGAPSETGVTYDGCGQLRHPPACEFDHYLLQHAGAPSCARHADHQHSRERRAMDRQRGDPRGDARRRRRLRMSGRADAQRLMSGGPLVVAQEAEPRFDAADLESLANRTGRAGAVLLPRPPGLRLVRAQGRLPQRRPRPPRSAIRCRRQPPGSSPFSKRGRRFRRACRGTGAATRTR